MLKVIKLLTISLLILIFFFVFWLFFGIKVDSFSFGNFSVNKFYLKLDKKLILKSNEVVFDSKILDDNLNEKTFDLNRVLENVKFGLKLFKQIDIKKIKILDNEYSISLNDEKLYINDDVIELSAKLDINSSLIFLDISSLYLKDFDLTLVGKSKIDLVKNQFDFYGKYKHLGIDGEINAMIKDGLLSFYLDTSHSIKSIKFLKDFFTLNKEAEKWMYENVKGDINLEYLYGKVDLEKKKLIMDSISGRVSIENSKVFFKKGAKSVDSEKITIDYENEKLSFDFFEPTYNNSKIYGSRVYITDLTSLQNGIVHVELKTNSNLNDDILEILEAYDINLPLRQISGDNDSKLYIKVPYLKAKKMNVLGEFKLRNAFLKLNDFEFFSKDAEVKLNNNLIEIKKAQIKHKDLLEFDLDLLIDTNSLKADGEAKIRDFNLNKESGSILNLENLTTKINIDFRKDTKLDIKALRTKIDFKDEYAKIDVEDLNRVYPYSNLLKNIDIKYGKAQIKLYDEKNIDFSFFAKNLDYPFAKNGEKIEEIKANGKLKNNIVTVNAEDEDIEVVLNNGNNPIIKLNNIDLILSDNNSLENNKKIPDLDLHLNNSYLSLDEEHNYLTSWANIYIRDSNIKFQGEALDLDLPISKDGNSVKTLELSGNYNNRVLDLETNDKNLKIKYELDKEKISMDLKDYDVVYNTKNQNDEESKTAYYINGKNSNIIMNKKHIAKADSYKFIFENFSTDIDLKYKNTTFNYRKDFAGFIKIDAKNMNDEFLNAILGKNLIEGGNVNITAVGKDRKIDGVAILKDNKIVDLAVLNNLLILINTSPGLINPLLAIPSVVGMATNEGFNLNGYRVVDGRMKFSYNFKNKFLDIEKIKTVGNGIDFDGSANIDFEKSEINSNLNLIFLKDYSKIVDTIPVVNYVLLGDKKRVETEVEIYGSLEDPKYKTNLIKEGISAPLNLIKRVITSPLKLFD